MPWEQIAGGLSTISGGRRNTSPVASDLRTPLLCWGTLPYQLGHASSQALGSLQVHYSVIALERKTQWPALGRAKVRGQVTGSKQTQNQPLGRISVLPLPLTVPFPKGTKRTKGNCQQSPVTPLESHFLFTSGYPGMGLRVH